MQLAPKPQHDFSRARAFPAARTGRQNSKQLIDIKVKYRLLV
jgi:hypothetical protein